MALLVRRVVALLLVCLIPVAALLTAVICTVWAVLWVLGRVMGVRP